MNKFLCVTSLFAAIAFSDVHGGVFDSFMEQNGGECKSTDYCCCDYDNHSSFYVGGGYSYIKSSYPQYFLQDLYTIQARNPLLVPDDVRYSKKINNNAWSAYGGYRYSLDCNWDFGLEAGYHDAGRIVNRSGPIEFYDFTLDPFRKINTYYWDILLTARYNFCNGVNIFAKLGPAYVHSKIKEGQLVSPQQPESSDKGIYSNRTYHLSNIYPEIVIGFGYKPIHFCNIVFSYSHIFGKSSPNSYDADSTVGTRPSNCASFDSISIAVEFSYDKLPF